MTSSAFHLLSEQLLDPGAGWSVGSFGAIAEFLRDPDEPVTIERGETAISAVTGRGGLLLRACGDLRPVAYEMAMSGSRFWSQAVALCLPEAACALSRRSVLTELGPDGDALRARDREAFLFDLGLAQRQAEICVRTHDTALLATLRAAAGGGLFEPGNPAMAAIVAASPHRVVLTRFARAEVYQPIPSPGGASPSGPHTHILPKLLRMARRHAATAPIPGGWIPAAHLFPAHPAKDPAGRPRPFDPGRHAAFQALLERYGLPELTGYKRQVLAALREGREPPAPATRFEKASLRASLAQWAYEAA